MKILRSVTVLMSEADKYCVTYDDMTYEIAKVKVLEGSSMCQVFTPGMPSVSSWVAIEELPEQVRREIAYAFKGVWSRLSEKIDAFKKEVTMKTFEEAWEHYQEHAVPPLMTEEKFREVFDLITPAQSQKACEEHEKPSGVPHTFGGFSTL